MQRSLPSDWTQRQMTYVPGMAFLLSRRYLVVVNLLYGPLGWWKLPRTLRVQRTKRGRLTRISDNQQIGEQENGNS